MALDKSGLKTALEDWMNGDTPDIATFASEVTGAYHTYAQDAVDISGDSPLSVNNSGMESILAALPPTGTAESASVVFETALVAYWTAGSFALTIPPAGTILPEISALVTTPPVPGPLATALAVVFNDLDEDVSTKAGQISDAFDVSTKTVIVTCIGTVAVPPPPTLPVPGPIS